MERYCLVVVTLNHDRSDEGGNVYPEKGFLTCEDFVSDKDIMTGLHGTLWGRITTPYYLNRLNNAKVVVVRVAMDQSLILIDSEANHVKFSSCEVVHWADEKDPFRSCQNFIQKQKEDDFSFLDTSIFDIDDNEMAGNFIESGGALEHIVTGAYGARALTHDVSTHAVVMNQRGHAMTEESFSHAISLDANSRTVASGDMSHGLAMGSNSRARTLGTRSVALTTDVGGTAICSGKDSIAVCLDVASEGCAGEDGALVLAWHDGKRRRMKVGYVGEDIEANTVYTVVDGEFEIVRKIT